MLRTLSILALAGTALAAAHMTPTVPAPGPGAVIAMHQKLFQAIDAGNAERALEFLSADLNMQDEHRGRPCTLFLVDGSGAPVTSVGAEASRELLASWIAASEGRWETKLTSARDDCFSGELSYAVLEFERKRTDTKKPVVRRYRSTSLVTYDEGWKITHWHVSPAGEAAAK